MLDPWIIEEIRRREQEVEEAPYLPLEQPLPLYREPDSETTPPASDRGIVIIDLY